MATEATPATGSYRPNPALGSGTWGVARRRARAGERRYRGAPGPAGPARTGGRPRADATMPGPPLEGRWLTDAGGTRAACRGCTWGRAPTACPRIGASCSADGAPWWESRSAPTGAATWPSAHVEWRFEAPVPAIPARLVRLDGHRLTVAPFVALGAAGRPFPGLPWAASDGIRPVAGVALEWFMRLLRVEAGVGLRDRRFRAHGGRQSGLVGLVVALLSSETASHAARPAFSHNRQSRSMQFTDEWLVHTIEPLLPEGTVAAIRQEPAPAPGALWEILVQRKLLADARSPPGHRQAVPDSRGRPEPPRSQAATGGARAGGPAVQRGPRRPDRLLSRDRHRQPVRHRRREDAGVRDRA